MDRRALMLGATASLLAPPALAWRGGFTVVPLQTAYVARGIGLFLHFNMSTFKDVEIASGSEPVNSFDPGATLNIDQWVTTAQAMKAKYACLTVKHHDGFCLWPTASVGQGTTPARHIGQTAWYANNGHIDIVSQFTSKFRTAGITPLLYYSIRDGSSSLQFATDAEIKTYTQAQITELLTNYGPIGALWFDGAAWWSRSIGKPDPYPWISYSERHAFIHSLQQNCLIADNGASTVTIPDTDIEEYENTTVPGANTRPAELVRPMRSDVQWFWKSTGNALISNATMLSEAAAAHAANATYMVNAGPDNTGVIPANMVSAATTFGASL